MQTLPSEFCCYPKYICQFCDDEYFEKFYEFSEHFTKEHCNKKGFFCTILGCDIDINEPIEQHFKKVHPFVCLICVRDIDEEKERKELSFAHSKCLKWMCDGDFVDRLFDCFYPSDDEDGEASSSQSREDSDSDSEDQDELSAPVETKELERAV